MTKRPALPYPPQALRDRQHLDASPRDSKNQLYDRLRQEHLDLQYKMELLEARMDAVSSWQPRSDSPNQKPTAVPDVPSLSTIQAAIGQLRWASDFTSKFKKLGDSVGNTNGVAWCNGLFLSDDYFLTVAHAFTIGGGWQRPNYNGEVPSPSNIASLFSVFGNDSEHQAPRDVEALIYHRPTGLDCAVVRLGPPASKQTPKALDSLINKIAPRKTSNRNTDLLDKEVYLVDPVGTDGKHDQSPLALHKVQITNQQHHSIGFTSVSEENTLSGTPLITQAGELIGLKISDTKAVDIRSIAQLLLSDNSIYGNTQDRVAQA